jgi:hypothetical protein
LKKVMKKKAKKLKSGNPHSIPTETLNRHALETILRTLETISRTLLIPSETHENHRELQEVTGRPRIHRTVGSVEDPKEAPRSQGNPRNKEKKDKRQ